MSEADFKIASDAQNTAWIDSGKAAFQSLCAVVDTSSGKRFTQECRFPNGYASTQSAALSDPRPASCQVQMSQQASPGMGSLRAIPMRRTAWIGQAAPAASAVKPLTDAQFSQALLAPKAVVMFYSPNCPYSRKFLPIYEALAPQYPDVLFASVNVLEQVQNAGKYGVSMLPTVVFLVSGTEVNKIPGVQDQSDFLSEMNRAFSGQAPAAAASAPPRSGTLVETPAPKAPTWAYVAGGAAAIAVLGIASYVAFGK